MNKNMNKKGSLYLGVLLLLIFLTAFMGIMLQQAFLFTALVRKKQQYSAHFYAVDALTEYGIAYALEHYTDFYSEPVLAPVSAPAFEPGAISASKEVALSLERWPEQEAQSPYSGNIVITKQEHGLEIQATLLAKGSVVRRLSCGIQKMPVEESAQSLFSRDRLV